MANKAQFNFSPASEHDDLVYGACRPGQQEPEDHNVPDKPISEGEVREWAKFMKEQGVKRVVSLLDQEEVQKAYDFDIAAVMQEEFTYNNIPINQPGTSGSIKKALDDAAEAKEKVVVHCWQGQGRAGLALAQWLVEHHKLSPEEAAQKVIETAKEGGACRRVNVERLQKQVGSQ